MQAVVNWFVFFGQQWKDLIQLFSPKNFKLLLFGTYSGWWRAVVSLFKNFWWLFIIFFALEGYFYFQEQFEWLLGAISFFSFISYYLFFLAIRPSVRIKDLWYYIKYSKHVLFFALYLIFFSVLFSMVLFPLTYGLPVFIDNFFGVKFVYPLVSMLIGLFFSNVVIFAFFFFADGKASMKNAFESLINGFKIFLYTLPFSGSIFLLLSLPVLVLNYFLTTSYFLINILLEKSVVAFFSSWLIAFYNTLYLKKAHENYDIYFE